SGQVYLMTAQGYGYWFFTWSPGDDREAVEDEWDGLRQGFTLLDQREGWTARPRPTAVHTGAGGAYRLNYAAELWRQQDNPEASDPGVDLDRRGYEPVVDEETGRKKVDAFAGRSATVQVLVLPKAATHEAAEQKARKHLLDREVAAFPQVKLEPIRNPRT